MWPHKKSQLYKRNRDRSLAEILHEHQNCIHIRQIAGIARIQIMQACAVNVALNGWGTGQYGRLSIHDSLYIVVYCIFCLYCCLILHEENLYACNALFVYTYIWGQWRNEKLSFVHQECDSVCLTESLKCIFCEASYKSIGWQFRIVRVTQTQYVKYEIRLVVPRRTPYALTVLL